MALPRWFVASSWLVAALSVGAAVLRGAGPDPIWWIVIYGATAAASVAAAHARRGWQAMLVIGVVTALWGGWLWAVVTADVWLDDRLGNVAAMGGRGQVIGDAAALTLVCVWAHVPGWFGWQASRRHRRATAGSNT